jgi:hypothetical protein
MQLAILFWFYKELDVCESRLRLLRLQNPGMHIFGLYGGPAEGAAEAERRLAGYLDDFYAYEGPASPRWRWANGDRLLVAWHAERGRALLWDTVAVLQWDVLLLQPVRRLFRMLKPGEALFSGLRPVAEVRDWWDWSNGKKRRALDSFEAAIRDGLGYEGPLWCCQFVLEALPRQFLDRLADLEMPEEGFVEYRMPTLARALGIPCCGEHPYQAWWYADPAAQDAPTHQRLLNAMGERGLSTLETVLDEVVERRIGVVHPYRARFPWWLMLRPVARLWAGFIRWRAKLAPVQDAG